MRNEKEIVDYNFNPSIKSGKHTRPRFLDPHIRSVSAKTDQIDPELEKMHIKMIRREMTPNINSRSRQQAMSRKKRSFADGTLMQPIPTVSVSDLRERVQPNPQVQHGKRKSQAEYNQEHLEGPKEQPQDAKNLNGADDEDPEHTTNIGQKLAIENLQKLPRTINNSEMQEVEALKNEIGQENGKGSKSDLLDMPPLLKHYNDDIPKEDDMVPVTGITSIRHEDAEKTPIKHKQANRYTNYKSSGKQKLKNSRVYKKLKKEEDEKSHVKFAIDDKYQVPGHGYSVEDNLLRSISPVKAVSIRTTSAKKSSNKKSSNKKFSGSKKFVKGFDVNPKFDYDRACLNIGEELDENRQFTKDTFGRCHGYASYDYNSSYRGYPQGQYVSVEGLDEEPHKKLPKARYIDPSEIMDLRDYKLPLEKTKDANNDRQYHYMQPCEKLAEEWEKKNPFRRSVSFKELEETENVYPFYNQKVPKNFDMKKEPGRITHPPDLDKRILQEKVDNSIKVQCEIFEDEFDNKSYIKINDTGYGGLSSIRGEPSYFKFQHQNVYPMNNLQEFCNTYQDASQVSYKEHNYCYRDKDAIDSVKTKHFFPKSNNSKMSLEPPYPMRPGHTQTQSHKISPKRMGRKKSTEKNMTGSHTPASHVMTEHVTPYNNMRSNKKKAQFQSVQQSSNVSRLKPYEDGANVPGFGSYDEIEENEGSLCFSDDDLISSDKVCVDRQPPKQVDDGNRHVKFNNEVLGSKAKGMHPKWGKHIKSNELYHNRGSVGNISQNKVSARKYNNKNPQERPLVFNSNEQRALYEQRLRTRERAELAKQRRRDMKWSNRDNSEKRVNKWDARKPNPSTKKAIKEQTEDENTIEPHITQQNVIDEAHDLLNNINDIDI